MSVNFFYFLETGYVECFFAFVVGLTYLNKNHSDW